MKKQTLLKTMLLLCALIVGGSSAWAEDVLHYTLDGTKKGSGSSYADAHDVTQNDMTWSVTGNVTENPWRIGGKNANTTNREVYSKTPMGSAITKTELEIGDINLPSVNSIKLIVASDASFSTKLDEIVETSFEANSTLTFSPTSGTEWATGAYYKFVFNVTTSSSNKYIQFKSAKFYKAGSTTPSINATDVEYSADETDGEIAYTITNPVAGKGLTASTTADWITLGDVTETNVPFTMTANTGALREATVVLTYKYGDGDADKATKEIKVTQKAPVVKYDVNISSMTNGSVSSGVARAEAGETVTLTISPSSGYKLVTISVTDEDDTDVALSGTGNTRTFTMPAKDVTISATFEKDYSIEYDFSFATMGTTGWGGSYAEHTKDYNEAEVKFSYASKQSGTITDIPTVKGSGTLGSRYVSVTLKEANATMKSATFALRHWTTKTVTITMYYSTDGGESWTSTDQEHEFTSSTNGENATLTATTLPAGTNAIKIEGDADQQYGVASVSIEINTAITISGAKYATYCGFGNIELAGTGIKAYTAEATGTNVQLHEIKDGIVPAGAGVVLYSETAKTYTIPVTSTDASDYNALANDNELIGITEETTVAQNGGEGKTNYILANETAGVGFYLATVGGAKLHANHAYLSTTATDTGAREFLGFGDGETTAIDGVKAASVENGAVYNLAGQRVAQPTKGLYIVNGKKYIVK